MDDVFLHWYMDVWSIGGDGGWYGGREVGMMEGGKEVGSPRPRIHL